MKRAKSSRVSHALFGSESTYHVPLRSTWCYRPNACSARGIGPTIRACGLFRQAPRFKIPRYSTKGILESWNSGIFSSLIRNKVDFDERNLIRRVRFCRAPSGLWSLFLPTPPGLLRAPGVTVSAPLRGSIPVYCGRAASTKLRRISPIGFKNQIQNPKRGLLFNARFQLIQCS